jgi:predicted nucleic acid-binding protein
LLRWTPTMTPHVDLLVAASRSDHPHHPTARQYLEQALAASAHGASFRVMPMVVASFLRLVTSPRIFKEPTPIDSAVAFVDAVLGAPGVEMGPRP